MKVGHLLAACLVIVVALAANLLGYMEGVSETLNACVREMKTR
jgi:hypothetical protein